MNRLRSWTRRRPRSAWMITAGVVAAAVFAIVWFQPQKLFIDETVDEAFPVPAAPTTTATTAAPTTTAPATTDEAASETTTSTTTTMTTTTPPLPELLTTGALIDVGHPGSGTASVFSLPNGALLLRFEDLDVSNGPDLRVILSTSPLVDDRSAYDEEFVDLGSLKGNRGNQNYDIPADIDLAEYATVAIWCRRFNYTFNAAPLTDVAETS